MAPGCNKWDSRRFAHMFKQLSKCTIVVWNEIRAGVFCNLCSCFLFSVISLKPGDLQNDINLVA